jgi:hypothetical protein
MAALLARSRRRRVHRFEDARGSVELAGRCDMRVDEGARCGGARPEASDLDAAVPGLGDMGIKGSFLTPSLS